MPITSGTVKYGRTLKPADYERISADVELTFIIPDNASEDQYIAAVGQVAVTKVYEILKLKAASPAAQTAVAQLVVENAGPEDKKAKVEAARKAKEAKEATKAAVDPAAVEDTKLVADPASVTVEDPASVENFEDFGPAPVEITDKDLVDALSKTNARIKNTAKLRAAIANYVDFPKQGRDIPQDQRQSFLNDLDKLTA